MMKTGLKLTVLIWFLTSFPVLAQAPATSIGQVDTLTGEVTATKLDGSKVALAQGDPVYQGYIIETGEEAAVGIVLADESVFSLDENSGITLDSMVYDPADKSGYATLSMVQGAFTFVSGQIAKSSPEGMMVTTPSADIGIRGTAAGFTVNPDITTVAMLEEPKELSGELLIRNKGGAQTINKPYQAVTIKSFKSRPSKPFKMSLKDLGVRFGGAMRVLPRAKKLIHKKIREEGARHFKARTAKLKARRAKAKAKFKDKAKAKAKAKHKDKAKAKLKDKAKHKDKAKAKFKDKAKAKAKHKFKDKAKAKAKHKFKAKAKAKAKAKMDKRLEERKKNIRRMMKRYEKSPRIRNVHPNIRSGSDSMDVSGMARRGAANRMRDADLTRSRKKLKKKIGDRHSSNPCYKSGGGAVKKKLKLKKKRHDKKRLKRRKKH